MTNTKAISFASILFIGGYVAWNVSRDLGAPLKLETYKRVWQAGVLALVVSVATDLNPDLGAAFGAMIVAGFALDRVSGGKPVFPPPAGSTAASAGRGSGSSGGRTKSGGGVRKDCPSGFGYVDKDGVLHCAEIATPQPIFP